MRWLGRLLAALALVAGVSACGSTIAVPDQGVIVTGCQNPGRCFRSDCGCARETLASCLVDSVCTNPLDQTTCNCPTALDVNTDAGTSVSSQCLETAMACVGRGTRCDGVGATCAPFNGTCAMSGNAGPMLVAGAGATLESHCQFTDDVCCPGVDGGVSTD
jgi:hypothetical protein